jgi:hypothetical protein
MGERERGGQGAESAGRKKAWPSIHSILSEDTPRQMYSLVEMCELAESTCSTVFSVPLLANVARVYTLFSHRIKTQKGERLSP